MTAIEHSLVIDGKKVCSCVSFNAEQLKEHINYYRKRAKVQAIDEAYIVIKSNANKKAAALTTANV